MVSRQLRTGADENRLLPATDLHRVVGHEAVPAHDEVERALALADAALADEQHAEPEDVHQHRVHDRPLGERVLEQRRQLRDRGRRGDGGLQQRQARALGFDDELPRRREAARDEDAGKIEGEREAQCRDARFRLEALEVPDLALAEDQNAARLEVLVEAGEREPRFLDVRARDDAREPVDAGEHFERQAERLGAAVDQRADAYGLLGHL